MSRSQFKCMAIPIKNGKLRTNLKDIQTDCDGNPRKDCTTKLKDKCMWTDSVQYVALKAPWIQSITHLDITKPTEQQEKNWRKKASQLPKTWDLDRAKSDIPKIISVVRDDNNEMTAYRIEYIKSDPKFKLNALFAKFLSGKVAQQKSVATKNVHTKHKNTVTNGHTTKTKPSNKISGNDPIHDERSKQALPPLIKAANIEVMNTLNRRRLSGIDVVNNVVPPYSSVGYIYYTGQSGGGIYEPALGAVGSIIHRSYEKHTGYVYVLGAAHDVAAVDIQNKLKMLDLKKFIFYPKVENDIMKTILQDQDQRRPPHALTFLEEVWLIENYIYNTEHWEDVAVFKFKIIFDKKYAPSEDQFFKRFPMIELDADTQLPGVDYDISKDDIHPIPENKKFIGEEVIAYHGKDFMDDFYVMHQFVSIFKSQKEEHHNAFCTYVGVPTQQGWCGSPVINTQNKKMIAIHVAGTLGCHYSGTIEKEEEEQKVSKYDNCQTFAAGITETRKNAIESIIKIDISLRNGDHEYAQHLQSSMQEKLITSQKFKENYDKIRVDDIKTVDEEALAEYVKQWELQQEQGIIDVANQEIDNVFVDDYAFVDDYDMDFYQDFMYKDDIWDNNNEYHRYNEYHRSNEYYQSDEGDIGIVEYIMDKIGYNVELTIIVMNITLLIILCTCVYVITIACIGWIATKLGRQYLKKQTIDDREYKTRSEMVNILNDDNATEEEELNHV